MSFTLSESGWPALNMDWQWNMKVRKPLYASGILILVETVLGILLFDPCVSFHHLMNKFFCLLLEKFCPLFKHFPDCSSLCPPSSSGQENGCFGLGVGLGVFCVQTHL